MAKYHGNCALDAEIEIDLEKGIFKTDYSLNNFKNMFDSNQSTVLNTDYKKPVIMRISHQEFLLFIMPFVSVGISLFHFIITAISKMPVIKNHPEIPFKSQQMLKWVYFHTKGINEYITIGKLDRNIIEHRIPFNLWCEYELDGDYKTKIKSIHLTRNFIKNTQWDRIQFKQDGWMLKLLFEEPPQYGSCILRYLA